MRKVKEKMTDINSLQKVEYSNRLILTTKQIAELYGTDERHIKQNFFHNKDLYVSGRDYFLLEGEDLKAFKDLVEKSYLVDKRAPSLYLWTERGAFHHSRHLHTKKAMEVYDVLISSYFQLREQQEASAPAPVMFPGFTNSLLIDRIRLFNANNDITCRKFCIFQEVAWDFFSAEMRGNTLPEGAVPDGSVGRRWSDHIKSLPHKYNMALVEDYPHQYPDQRKTRFPCLYPIEWLPDFKIWFREVYLPVYFPLYLKDTLKIKGPEVKQILTSFRVVQQIEN